MVKFALFRHPPNVDFVVFSRANVSFRGAEPPWLPNNLHPGHSSPHTAIWDLAVVPFLVSVCGVAPWSIHIIVRVSTILKVKRGAE